MPLFASESETCGNLGVFGLLNVAPFKNDPVLLTQTAELEFLHSNLARPKQTTCPCSTIASTKSCDADKFRFVDVLRAPVTGIAPCIGAQERRNTFFGDLRYTFSRPMHHKQYANIGKTLLLTDRVKRGIGRSVAHDCESTPVSLSASTALERRAQSKAASCLKEMAATLNLYVARFIGWCIFKIFRRVLSGILVSPAEMVAIQEVEQLNLPIIYVPLHKSHLDYVLLTFVLWHWDVRLPYVASGDNLNLGGLGWLLRCLGAFFIRRRMDGDCVGKDFVYRAVLHSYMEELLIQKQSIEFFPEGTRTRTGKTLVPKSGLLSVVVDSYLDGKIEDAVLIPVAATYEHLIEGNFVDELMGRRKQRESMFGVIRNVWHSFGKNLGYARLEFGQPLRLSAAATSLKPILGSRKNAKAESLIVGSPSELSSDSDRSTDVDRRSLIHAIACHLISDSEWHASITVSQMLAALLLSKHRRGVSLADLCVDFNWLAHDVAAKGRDVIGCSPTLTDPLLAVARAVRLLGQELVSVETSASDSDSGISEDEKTLFCAGDNLDLCYVNARSTIIKPVLEHRQALQLVYYKNGYLAAFHLDCVIACTLLSYRCDFVSNAVLQSEIINRAVFLCSLLKYEFVFNKPCQSLERLLQGSLEQFITGKHLLLQRYRPDIGNEIIRELDEDWVEDVMHGFGEKRSPGFGKVDFESPKDEEQLIAISAHCTWRSVNVIQFLANLARPLIESYVRLLRKLLILAQNGVSSIDEKQLISELFDESSEALGSPAFVETLNTDSFKNAVRLCSDWQLVRLRASEERKSSSTLVHIKSGVETQELSDLIDNVIVFLD